MLPKQPIAILPSREWSVQSISRGRHPIVPSSPALPTISLSTQNKTVIISRFPATAVEGSN